MNHKSTLISCNDVDVVFDSGSSSPIHAITNASIDIYNGRCTAVVGESGSGKSTFARCLVHIVKPTNGTIEYNGLDIHNMTTLQQHEYRKSVQMIFQDSFSSLNPAFRIQDILDEVYHIHHPEKNRTERQQNIDDILKAVGLPKQALYQYPYELSGGQRQRVGIARALACDAQCIICDEVVSALDVSVQAQIITLLKDLQKKRQITLIFITHDLAVVKYIAHDVLVMYLGHIVERASTSKLYQSPKHPYTQLLYASVPQPDPRVEKKRRKPIIKGDMPTQHDAFPSSCPFVSRCPHAHARCHTEKPRLKRHFSNHYIACHLYDK